MAFKWHFPLANTVQRFSITKGILAKPVWLYKVVNYSVCSAFLNCWFIGVWFFFQSFKQRSIHLNFCSFCFKSGAVEFLQFTHSNMLHQYRGRWSTTDTPVPQKHLLIQFRIFLSCQVVCLQILVWALKEAYLEQVLNLLAFVHTQDLWSSSYLPFLSTFQVMRNGQNKVGMLLT